MTVQILQGDCRELLRRLQANSFDACVCDPPYHLTEGKKGGSGPASVNTNSPAGRARIGAGFMGQAWDGGDVAYQIDTWAEVFRVLKPGAHLLAFGGTRTYHRMACAIEDAGFEIRDCIRSEQGQETWPGWVYGSGFPKSLNAAKAIDRHLGAKGGRAPVGKAVRRIVPGADQNGTGSWEKLEDRTYQPHAYEPATAEAAEWQGWGTALKPAWEPIVVARKPLDGTVAENLLEHGCGALNIDGSRVEVDQAADAGQLRLNNRGRRVQEQNGQTWGLSDQVSPMVRPDGRWPANLVHDGSAEVEAAFAAFGARTSGKPGIKRKGNDGPCFAAESRPPGTPMSGFGDTGSASRFFYSAKANKQDRAGSKHPTVKPIALMRYLVRLVTPPPVLMCEQCNTRKYGNSTTPAGSVSPLRNMSGAIQAEGQSAQAQVLQQGMRNEGDGPASGSGLRGMSGQVQARSGVEGEPLLLKGVRNAGDGGQVGEGLHDESARLQTALPARPSSGVQERVHVGASEGCGGDARSASSEHRGCAPSQRSESRQSARKPSGNGQAIARRNTEAAAEADQMPPLREGNQGFRACPACGGNLIVQRAKVLDPFAGSGTTGEAAHLEGFDATLCELLQDHVADIRRRLGRVECNITEGLRGGVGGPGVNITPPKAVHNKHYVALGGST